jgi:hypothetical protein
MLGAQRLQKLERAKAEATAAEFQRPCGENPALADPEGLRQPAILDRMEGRDEA